MLLITLYVLNKCSKRGMTSEKHTRWRLFDSRSEQD
ncbi:hypothetical protein IHE45_06G095800 [Dioscorea alata]|uniref:Uncharacterized protein n=1 Tax=Dioscorea alata TaxID=55571 RepID=A0ACB7VZF5_DIOAL|nr:hypothetical protein IHE45_06G095800 [Dioscorea alata]